MTENQANEVNIDQEKLDAYLERTNATKAFGYSQLASGYLFLRDLGNAQLYFLKAEEAICIEDTDKLKSRIYHHLSIIADIKGDIERKKHYEERRDKFTDCPHMMSLSELPPSFRKFLGGM